MYSLYVCQLDCILVDGGHNHTQLPNNVVYIAFPGATTSGIQLLIARRAVLEWSQRRNCTYSEHYTDDCCYTITFGEERWYTLFLLEWEQPPAYIVTEKIAAQKFVELEISAPADLV